MNFEKFEKLIKTHKGLSVILIALFVLGIVFQITDAYTKISSLVEPNIFPPKIISLEIATNKSVYVEYERLTDKEKEIIKPTQLYRLEKNNRNFVYDNSVVNNLYYSNDAIQIALFSNAIINHGLSSGIIKKSSNEYDFLHTLVQKRNFVNLVEYLFSEILPRERLLKKTDYLQNINERSSIFLASLEHLEQHKGRSYKKLSKSVPRGEIEDLISRYAPIIRNQFEPVFEITLFNPNESEVLIKTIDLIVHEIDEYKGIGEKPAHSDILTFRLPTNPDRISKDIDDLSIKAKSHLKVLIRLEPQKRFSTYRLNFEFTWGDDDVVSTEEIFVDA